MIMQCKSMSAAVSTSDLHLWKLSLSLDKAVCHCQTCHSIFRISEDDIFILLKYTMVEETLSSRPMACCDCT